MRVRCPLLLLAAVVAGCPDKSGGGAADAGRAAALRVPIPSGWQATARDGTLEVGRGRDIVLVIERDRLGTGGKLPSTDELKAAFAAGLGVSDLRVLRAEENGSLSLVAFEFGPEATPSMAFVGVKRLGEDWFMCRSAPGKSADDLQVAVAACRGLEWK